jgi:subtilisin-like proprotein convertase family protein
MWRNPGESAGSPFQGSVYGWNFVNNNANPMDDNGHGTHVAGIIGAVGNNGVGVSGVAWNVQLMAVKILNYAGSGFTSDAIRGLNFAVSRGAKIANNSWGGAPYDPALASAINEARAQGVIVVAAAGNQGRNIDTTPFYPASYQFDNVVRVAATDNRDALASFSNFGVGTVQLAAPGVNIISTSRTGGYVSMSGTSMAAPMVSGALALVWDQNPSWSYQQVIQRVLSTVDPIPALASRVSTGGRLNLGRALAGGSAGGGGNGGGGGSSPTAAWVTSLTALTISSTLVGFRLTFSSPIQASSFTLEDVVAASGPQGNLTVTGVTAVPGSNTQFDVNVAPQSMAGTYRLTIGPQILTLSGVPMDQNRNGIPGETPADQFSGSLALGSSGTTFNASGLPLNLPDVRSTSVTMSIGSSIVIQNLAVRLNVTHTWIGDLLITLRGPSGQTATLINRRGGSGQNLTDTLFSDSASTSIANGVAPFTGVFRPESPLSVFNGTNVRGFWTLTISDQAAGNSGRLISWSLIVNSTSGSAVAWSAGEETEAGIAEGSKADAWLPAPALDIAAVSSSQRGATQEGQGAWPWSALSDSPSSKGEETIPGRAHSTVFEKSRVAVQRPINVSRPPALLRLTWADKLSAFHRLG